MERGNLVKDKSFDFALATIKLVKKLQVEHKEFIMSKQLMRSSTSVGANVREANNAQSVKDFIHKMNIAQKEIDESRYWLELLYKSDYIDADVFNKFHEKATEILKILTKIISTSKIKLNKGEH